MQDTPNFENIKNRFSGYNKDDLLGQSSNQPIQGNDAQVLERIFEEYPVYFSDNAFRQRLTAQAKETIENQVNASCDQFDRINNERSANNLPNNLSDIIRNLSTYLEEFRYRFSYPRRIVTLEGGKDVGETLRQIEQTKEDATKKLGEIENVLQLSSDFVGYKGETELANHFHRLYNGQTLEEAEGQRSGENSKKGKNSKIKINSREYFFISIIVALIASFSAQKLWSYLKNHDLEKLYIFAISFLILLVVPLAVYAIVKFNRWFNKRYKGGYEKTAALWFLGIVFSLIFVAVYATVAVRALNIDVNNLTLGEAFIKAVVLVAPLFLVRFCVRNFNANRHLAATNLQRAIGIRTFRPFIQNLNTENAPAQKEVYVAMTSLIFKQDESGYITRREGAGSSDSNINLPWSLS